MDDTLLPIGDALDGAFDVDDEVAAEFNRLPEIEIPEELRELCELHPLDMSGGGPSPKNPLWGKWQGLRRTYRALTEPKPEPKPKLSAADVVAAAASEPDATPEATALVAQKLAQPHRAAAIAKLVRDLESNDEGLAQRAAIKLLEISDGKPGQQPAEQATGPTIIEYHTVALQRESAPFVPGASLTETSTAP